MSSSISKNWKIEAQSRKSEFTRWLKQSKNKKWIKKLPEINDRVFSEIDCLDCAGCCKNISPRFKVPDVERIASHLGMKQSQLIDTYLRVDEDGDFVVKSSPCPFLASDNRCNIYEVRPRDCSRYPYIDSDQLIKRVNTTINNLDYCPAVYRALCMMIDNK